jgi:hypothetical protein
MLGYYHFQGGVLQSARQEFFSLQTENLGKIGIHGFKKPENLMP